MTGLKHIPSVFYSWNINKYDRVADNYKQIFSLTHGEFRLISTSNRYWKDLDTIYISFKTNLANNIQRKISLYLIKIKSHTLSYMFTYFLLSSFKVSRMSPKQPEDLIIKSLFWLPKTLLFVNFINVVLGLKFVPWHRLGTAFHRLHL